MYVYFVKEKKNWHSSHMPSFKPSMENSTEKNAEKERKILHMDFVCI